MGQRPQSQMKVDRPSSAQQLRPQSAMEKETLREQADWSKLPLKAHPMEIITAYEKLLIKEKQQRGTSYDLDIVNALAYEVQCLRIEKNKLQHELKITKAKTIHHEQQTISLRKELEQLNNQVTTAA
uniref:Uncharacterized protein n=1 Tax=Trepomonas sp. PC1 TaxID=1076344 RepID=A0A146K3X0_9EUKA|eukprot:JAP91593.1 hypothetical protein TPC1_16750 [Trepomonas sp. PC1]